MIRLEQLQSILELNKRIDNKIQNEVKRDFDKYYEEGINIAETISIKLNEMAELISIPINDDKIGGLIVKKRDQYYCLINTNQPRAFQNFVYLHEFYHLLYTNDENFHVISDTIENEINIEERKANYYASLMLVSKEALRKNYYHFAKDRGFDLKTTIYYLMNLFKTTYKTILIRLFEVGCIEDFQVLFDNFNNGMQEIQENFIKLGLDQSIIQPSNATSIGKIDYYIKMVEDKETMLEDILQLNTKRYYEIIKEIKAIQEQ